MHKLHLTKIVLICCTLFLLLFPATNSFASFSSFSPSYVQSIFVEDISLTVRFPETVWALTQTTPFTDDYFRLNMCDEDFYNNAISYMKSNSNFLQVFNHSDTWEMRINVIDRIQFSLNNISPELAQTRLNEMTTNLSSMGMQIHESCYVMHPQAAILMVCYVQEERNMIMCMTTTNTQTLLLVFSDAFFGSISASELKALAHNVIDGLIFHLDAPLDQSHFQKVCIDEIGVSLFLPSSMKWATRNNGAVDYVAATYQQHPNALPAYMENNNYHMMAVDPDSDFRAGLLLMEATGDTKNSVLLTDQDLLYDLKNEKLEVLWSLYSVQDQWVYRSEHASFACLLMKLGNSSHYTINAITAVDGFYYILLLRDTDPTLLRMKSESVMRAFSVNRPSTSMPLSLNLVDITLKLPSNWLLLSQKSNLILNRAENESLTLQTNAIDGTRRIVTLTITDVCGSVSDSPPTLAERTAFDQAFGEQLVIPQIQAEGYDVISTLTCGNSEFALFQTSDNQTSAVIASIVQGYVLRVEWFLPYGDALTDTWFMHLHYFVGELVKALKTV